jgi:hypothetical protein
MQRCGRCKVLKSEQEFNPSKRGLGDGHWCKSCAAASARGVKAKASHPPIACSECGESFIPLQLKPNTAVVFCSSRCKDKHRRTVRLAAKAAEAPRHCVHCGSVLPASMRRDAKFCSSNCNSAAHQVTRKMAKRANDKRSPGGELVSRAYIAERDGYRCGLCGGKVNMGLKHPNPRCASIDHIVPLSLNGGNDRSNLQLAHLGCNLVKRATAMGEQMRLVG